MAVSSTFTPHPDLRNGVTPNIDFYHHMYASTSAGTAMYSLTSASADAITSTKFYTQTIPLSSYSIVVNHGTTPSTAVTGYYGTIASGKYAQVNSALRWTSASADELQNEWGYFNWTTVILDSVADAVSGVEHFSHPIYNGFFTNTDDEVSTTANWVTITGYAWNVDETGEEDAYNVTPSDIILYFYDSQQGTRVYAVNSASSDPQPGFDQANHFYRTIPMSDFTVGIKNYYWFKLTETWGSKVSYSLTGYFTPDGGSSIDKSATAATGDITGSTRGSSITSYHSSVAISVNGQASTGGSEWRWKDIFNEIWT